MKEKMLKFKNNIIKYISFNRLFLSYVILAMIETILIRNFTLRNTFAFKPFICDLAMVVMIGAFGYLFKPRKQFKYFFLCLMIITIMCVVNSVYYIFYTSFASFSLLVELGLVGEVGDSLTDRLRIIDFIYFLFPVIYLMINTKLKKGSYFYYVEKVESGIKNFTKTIIAGLCILLITIVTLTKTDLSRLVKQWNREYIVSRFGIVLYQTNDLIQSLTPKINSLFGYDEAAKNFKDYYRNMIEESKAKKSNQYTNLLKDMNIIFVHMESMQNYLVDLKINDQELTPTLNQLTREGMYFDHFYPQISVGTSSDTEFTLNTSLMPVSSGTVFVSYYKRNYVSIPKLLKEKGYYTFSTHGNSSSMWNRNRMHPSLGYEEMIFKDQFEIEEFNDKTWVGLGISDVEFYKQLQPKLEKIETEKEHYMGTIIQLSNHSPFAAIEPKRHPERYNDFGELDLTNTYKVVDEKTGEEKEFVDDYLKGTQLGNYLISAHYADMALGTFLDYIKNSPYYENTVFVFYGDHDAKVSRTEYQYYYNYDLETGKERTESDPLYREYDVIDYAIDKNTPLVIWTKNSNVAKKLKGVNSNVMGMYDVLPTIGNMMGFESQYALGHDIFDVKDKNVVIFPSGNFITNYVYYNNTTGTYRILNGSNKNNIELSEDYIENIKNDIEEKLSISNDIIVYDLIEKEGDNILKGDNNNEKEKE